MFHDSVRLLLVFHQNIFERAAFDQKPVFY